MVGVGPLSNPGYPYLQAGYFRLRRGGHEVGICVRRYAELIRPGGDGRRHGLADSEPEPYTEEGAIGSHLE